MTTTALDSTSSVLHVSQPTDAGVARIVADLAAAQVQRGWRVAVASPTSGALATWIRAAGALHLEWPAGRSPGVSLAAEIRRLARCVSSFRPDLVHLHSSKAGLAGRLLLRGRAPTVFEPNAWSFEALTGPAAAAARAWERRAAGWAHATVCVSEAERDLGRRAGIDGRWRVVPNGIDLERWRPASPADRATARRLLGLSDEPIAVCVGRLSEQKGQDVLLDAWRLVVARRPGARLYLVGDGPLRGALEARRIPRVAFVGARDDVPAWLAAAHVVVFASRWEGCSLAMLEAMARSRSVVITDVSGAREAIADDAGQVVPIETPAAIADAVAARLEDPERGDAEGAAGRRRVEARHDLRKTAADIVGVYLDVLDARG